MVCSPNSNSLNPPSLGPPPNIGFGPIFAPIQIPFPDIKLPEGVPEDILELLQRIFALIPGGRLTPNADDAMRTVFGAIASLLNQLGPYLALYNFFQALLEMVMCIIDVICALLNPFATIGAVIRLFKRCIPNFLSLFPFLALIAMILAFILLLIALIEFLINYIIAIINDIIENINALAEAFQVGDESGALAIIQKIASLLCLIEQAFALLIAFQALFVIIQSLMQLAGREPCSPNSICCDEEFCPNFIKNSPDGIPGTSGRLIYHRQATGRAARWQFVDDAKITYPFKDIITPINGNTYWPEPLSFQNDNNLVTVVPYTADLTMTVNPALFSISLANETARTFVIKNCIVAIKPYVGVLSYNGALNYGTQAPSPMTGTAFGNYDGTIQLIGGEVYEADGTTRVYSTSGVALSIESFVYLSPVGTVTSEDAVQIPFINYTFKINHKVLLKYQLISSGCIPEIATESALVAATNDFSSTFAKIGDLPDLGQALACLNSSLASFRKDVSLENAGIFQSNILSCLGNLRDSAINTFKNAFVAGISPYNSEFTIDPDIQFVSEPIKVTVNLKDQGGNNLGSNIPLEIQEELASKLEGHITFGEISKFTYDGYLSFTANINSDTVGTGELSVSYDNNLFSSIINRDNDDVATEVVIKKLPYQFVGGFANGTRDGVERRDDTDVANSG